MKNALALGLALALAACVPAPYGTYLRPSHPDPSSVVSQAYCGGQAGPPTRLAFAAPGNLKIAVSSPPGEPKAAAWPLAVTVSVPPGARFRFVEPHVRVAAAEGDAGRIVVPEVRVRLLARVPADGWIDVARIGPTSAEVARQALARDPQQTIAEVRLAQATWAGRAPQRVEVRLPAIETGGRRVEPPPQMLQAAETRSTGYQALRTRERAAQLAERETICRRDSPGKACENIARYDAQSFDVIDGPFAYRGRFWNFVAARPEPMRYEVMIAARTAEPWRLGESVVHLVDRASGERHAQRIAELHAFLAYPVPLSAAIEATGAELDLRLNLPDGARSRYLVRLPDYELNGVRHALAPITLEMRRFDGGLEPFNC